MPLANKLPLEVMAYISQWICINNDQNDSGEREAEIPLIGRGFPCLGKTSEIPVLFSSAILVSDDQQVITMTTVDLLQISMFIPQVEQSFGGHFSFYLSSIATQYLNLGTKY